MGRVEKKVCMVTGAAMGLGEATARLLAREGARVVLTDLKDAEGEAVAASIRKAGGDALYLHHDVADEGAWEEVMKQTVAAHGRLDALVNNAGVVRACPPHEQTLESWRWLMSINLDGVFLGTKHAMRPMMAAPTGRQRTSCRSSSGCRRSLPSGFRSRSARSARRGVPAGQR